MLNCGPFFPWQRHAESQLKKSLVDLVEPVSTGPPTITYQVSKALLWLEGAACCHEEAAPAVNVLMERKIRVRRAFIQIHLHVNDVRVVDP